MADSVDGYLELRQSTIGGIQLVLILRPYKSLDRLLRVIRMVSICYMHCEQILLFRQGFLINQQRNPLIWAKSSHKLQRLSVVDWTRASHPSWILIIIAMERGFHNLLVLFFYLTVLEVAKTFLVSIQAMVSEALHRYIPPLCHLDYQQRNRCKNLLLHNTIGN